MRKRLDVCQVVGWFYAAALATPVTVLVLTHLPKESSMYEQAMTDLYEGWAAARAGYAALTGAELSWWLALKVLLGGGLSWAGSYAWNRLMRFGVVGLLWRGLLVGLVWGGARAVAGLPERRRRLAAARRAELVESIRAAMFPPGYPLLGATRVEWLPEATPGCPGCGGGCADCSPTGTAPPKEPKDYVAPPTHHGHNHALGVPVHASTSNLAALFQHSPDPRTGECPCGGCKTVPAGARKREDKEVEDKPRARVRRTDANGVTYEEDL